MKEDGWRGNKIKEREIRNAIKQFLPGDAALDRVFELVKNQKSDY